MRLENILDIRVGQNVSRLDIDQWSPHSMYTNDDLMRDLYENREDLQRNLDEIHRSDQKYVVSQGEVMYSFISSQAGVVSQKNAGKVWNQNFAKLSPKNGEIDPKYLCYILNESPKIKKQKAILMQGSVVPKMTPAIMRRIEVFLPDLKKQISIGEKYFEMNRYRYLSEREAELKEKIYLELLKKIDH